GSPTVSPQGEDNPVPLVPRGSTFSRKSKKRFKSEPQGRDQGRQHAQYFSNAERLVTFTKLRPVAMLLTPSEISREQSIDWWFCLRAQVKREHIAAACLRQHTEVTVFCPR